MSSLLLRITALGLCLLLVGLVIPPPSKAAADDVTADVTALKAAGVETTGPGLLAFFKKRTLSSEKRDKIAKLVEQLGADDYETREKATEDLIKLGDVGRPQVAQATKSTDPEVRKRASRVLVNIGVSAPEAHLFAAAARVLADRKPAGAAEVLLEFLPNVEDAGVAEDVAQSLAPLALDKEKKPDPVVLKALSDKFAVKRYAAACALAKAAGEKHRAGVRKLLKDADVGVRRRVAVSLLEAKDKAAVSTLIDLLNNDSAEDAGIAEEALRAIAGEKGPEEPDADSEKAREKYKKAWASWWKDNEEKVDLAKVDLNAAISGTLLVGVQGTGVVKGGKGMRTNGQLLALDSAGKVKWKIDNLYYPIHASMVKRDRVLICEYSYTRVTERDLKGKTIWTKNMSYQVRTAERLPNGNTLVVTAYQIQELDKDQNAVKTITRTSNDILAAHRYKDGKYCIVTTNGNVIKTDKEGKETSSYNIGFLSAPLGYRVHFLPSGGVIIPNYGNNKIQEFDSSGKKVMDVASPMMYPQAVIRLANGNTLVASQQSDKIVEIDKKGKEVSSKTVAGRPFFIERK